MALFRAREIRQGATEDELRRQLNEAFKLIERDLTAALSSPKVSEVITASTYAPSFGEVARTAPPSTGLALVLPEPNLSRVDARITVVQEAASGPMTVEVVNGTINGAATLAYLAGVGTVEFILTPTGWHGWSVSLVSDLPLTSLADQIAESLLGNFTAGAAPPTARAGSDVAGGGLTYTAGGTLAVGAGTGLTVNANDVAVTIPLTDGDKGDITVATSGTAWSIDALAVTTGKLADDAVTLAKLADSSVVPANLVADNNFGVPFLIREPLTAGAAGTADDVTIYNANAPFAFRIVEAWVQVSTAIVGTTAQLRTATGGGGSALSTALSTAATGTARNNDTASRSVAAGGSVFVRRTDRGIAGTIIIAALRE